MKNHYPCYVANRAKWTDRHLEVTNKYTGEIATRVSLANGELLEEAIAAADRAAAPMRQLKGYQRQAVLNELVHQCESRHEELAKGLCIEAGKPITYARGEVTRLIDTLRIGAEEAVRNYGEIQPLDISERAKNYFGMWKRVPVGPCGFITPWNFPLNLVAHKIAPAIAAGCPFVLKPASATPVGALLLGEMLSECSLPQGAFSILPLRAADAGPLVEDGRIRKLSFTGSPEIGWDLRARAGKKKVSLELGGNAAVIVDETWTDLDDAVSRILFGAFYQSGQSCVGVQRILVHRSIYQSLRDKLVTATSQLKSGDPLDEQTFIGPIISASEAQRIECWVREAIDSGATLLCGGTRRGNIVDATLLENVPEGAKISCQEVFGPVAVMSAFDDFSEALQRTNDSRFGLQAGIFTRDIYRAHQAWDELEVGGVIIGEVPSYRVDNMPYGGVKDSGMGREGIRFAIADMTEIRLMVLRTP